MKRYLIYPALLLVILVAATVQATAQGEGTTADPVPGAGEYASVEKMAYGVLEKGFNAGDGYNQVWARDLNTFIRYSCRVLDQKLVRDALLNFFYFQGFDGNMVDGYEQVGPAYEVDNYHVYSRYDMPGYVFHKNTVETDQETSLIQAVYKYILETGDKSVLEEEVNGMTVLDRMELMLDFLMKHRYNSEYGLIWGATTIDWGDVQPSHPWGVKLDDQSVIAMDVYDNAMMLIALDNFLELCSEPERSDRWRKVYREIKVNTRKYLWDEAGQKFRPHLYLQCAAFEGVDEERIYYHGGTIVAMEAGLLTKEEIALSLAKMRENVQAAGAQSIGLTIYPAYPEGSFENRGLGPYQYQNGGDWTWFGARIIPVLVGEGMAEDAKRELKPFIERVLANDGFFEWYTLDGQPRGSGIFKGSAGVLLEAIDAVRTLQ
jgi:hypothetical protein